MDCELYTSRLKVGIIAIALLVTFFVSISYVYAVGVGIAPATIEVTDVLKGGFMIKTIAISNPESFDEEVTLSTGTYGCSPWISFEKPTIVVGAKSEIKIKLLIKVPADAGGGTHTCEISASASAVASAAGTGMGATATSVANVRITLTGERKIDGNIHSFDALDAAKGEAVKITLGFVNWGNVDETPSIKIDITKDGKTVSTLSKNDETFRPGELKVILLQWDTKNVEIGDYSAGATVTLSNNKELKASDSFKVLESAGAIKEIVKEVKIIEKVGVSSTTFIIVAVIIAVAIIVAAVLITRKKQGTV